MSSSKPSRPSGIVTLLTDFGTEDPFVGVMKGVLLTLTPGARLVDLTHAIPPQRVSAAAFWLARSFRYFPRGTVHLAVVDPGVGTSRRPIALLSYGHYFVGPDNGLFTEVLEAASAVHTLDSAAFQAQRAARLPGLGQQSATFHGRDVFAPAAGMLAGGAELHALGPEIDVPAPVLLEASKEPLVEVIDHFGNLITNVPWSPERGPAQVHLGGRMLRWVSTYGDAEPFECVALLGSFGTIEIAQRNGSAAEELGASVGQLVTISAP